MSFTNNVVGLVRQTSKNLSTLPIMAIGLALLYIAKLFLLNEVQTAVAFTGLFIIVVSVTVELYSYLQRGRSYYLTNNEELESSSPQKLEQFTTQITEITNRLNHYELEFAEKIFSETDKEELKRKILDTLPEIELKEVISEAARKHIDAQRQIATSDSRALYDGVISSLNRQIVDLGRRANLNLVMGSSITILGLVVLGYFVFFAIHPTPAEITETAIYFTTRLTLVVFIEVFAYFFLRLYRYSIFEIKYFQNEITNARFKIIALEICSREGTKTTLDKLCLELAKTERNFVLKKGETTISLRRDEIEQMDDSSVAKLLESFLNSRDSGGTTGHKVN
jgi:hypothetical protein